MFARLLLLFIVVPLIELILLLKVGSMIGPWPTLAIILVTAFLGASLTRSQGLRVLQRFQSALAEGRLPHEEVMEGLMILVAGAVLLTPGFLTDAAGFLLLVPAVRRAVRQRVQRTLKGRVRVMTAFAPDMEEGKERRGADRARVVEAKVIDE